MTIRKEIIEQYTSEYIIVKELAVAGFRSPGESSFQARGNSAGIGKFENGAFFGTKSKPGEFSYGGTGAGNGGGGNGGGGYGGGNNGGGRGGGDESQEVITDDHHSAMMEIKENDQRFVSRNILKDTMEKFNTCDRIT